MAKSMAWSDPDTGGVAAPRPRCAGVTAGGELVFVLFGLAATLGIMESEDAELLVLVVTASMILSPVLLALYDVTFKGTQSKLAPNLIRLKKSDRSGGARSPGYSNTHSQHCQALGAAAHPATFDICFRGPRIEAAAWT